MKIHGFTNLEIYVCLYATHEVRSPQTQMTKSESSLLLASKSTPQKGHATRLKRAGVKPSVTAVTYGFSDCIELLQYIYCEICLLHCKILGPLQRYYGCQVRRGWIVSQGTREEKRQKQIEETVDAFWTCSETRTVSLVQWLLLVSGHQMVLVRKGKAWANERLAGWWALRQPTWTPPQCYKDDWHRNTREMLN